MCVYFKVNYQLINIIYWTYLVTAWSTHNIKYHSIGAFRLLVSWCDLPCKSLQNQPSSYCSFCCWATVARIQLPQSHVQLLLCRRCPSHDLQAAAAELGLTLWKIYWNLLNHSSWQNLGGECWAMVALDPQIHRTAACGITVVSHRRLITTSQNPQLHRINCQKQDMKPCKQRLCRNGNFELSNGSMYYTIVWACGLQIPIKFIRCFLDDMFSVWWEVRFSRIYHYDYWWIDLPIKNGDWSSLFHSYTYQRCWDHSQAPEDWSHAGDIPVWHRFWHRCW